MHGNRKLLRTLATQMSSSCSCKTGVPKSAFIPNMSQYLQAVSLVFICSLVGACHSCGNVTLNCTNVVSAVPCHELACLKMHWHNLPPYVYHAQRNSTIMPYGILIGWFSNWVRLF